MMVFLRLLPRKHSPPLFSTIDKYIYATNDKDILLDQLISKEIVFNH